MGARSSLDQKSGHPHILTPWRTILFNPFFHLCERLLWDETCVWRHGWKWILRVSKSAPSQRRISSPVITDKHEEPCWEDLALSETEESATVSNASQPPRCRSVTTSWDPYFLSWTVLTGFILLFLLMIVRLEVLAWYSRTMMVSQPQTRTSTTYGRTDQRQVRRLVS